MARWHRSSDGPVPYGPPPQRADDGESGEGGAPPERPEPVAPPAAPGAWTSAPGLPPPPPGAPGGAPEPIAPWSPPSGAYHAVVPGAPGLQYGRTLDRVMAYLLDGFIIAIPTIVIAFVIGISGFGAGMREEGISLVGGIVGLGIHLLYFVSFWTGGSRATPGMRLMKLQIGDARTGGVPTVQQGLIRWLAFGGALQFLELVPALAVLGVLLILGWDIILLATTASSPTKQGLHDRMANTALVQPAGVSTPAVTCLVIFVALFALWIVGVVALVFLGGQVSSILSSVGDSI